MVCSDEKHTALSVRPGKYFAISAHLFPSAACTSNNLLSSAGDHGPLTTSGSRWLQYRSRHCLPSRVMTYFAILDHDFFPNTATLLRSKLSSSGDHFPFRMCSLLMVGRSVSRCEQLALPFCVEGGLGVKSITVGGLAWFEAQVTPNQCGTLDQTGNSKQTKSVTDASSGCILILGKSFFSRRKSTMPGRGLLRSALLQQSVLSPLRRIVECLWSLCNLSLITLSVDTRRMGCP